MISLSVTDHIATITLHRPPVNAINEEWLDRMNAAIDEIAASSQVSVVLIGSGERVFCAGADLSLMSRRFDTTEGRDLMIAFVRRMQQTYERLENLGAVSIARIEGAAMGGGLELALACDLRVICETARVGLPEARLGLLPGAGGTQRMTRKCGDDVARRLILGAEIVDGRMARELRIAQWCVAASEIADFTRELAERVGTSTGAALAECKHCIAAVDSQGEDGFERELAGTRALLETEQTRLRVREFLNSRAQT
ncbi:MAG: enoyl-CoA hydratase/isomerase family protein [Rhodobacteraceae bacterium]|nr:enoyl-CoA hydratase/isomerase family protein [Paracoccaceae bacterium]